MILLPATVTPELAAAASRCATLVDPAWFRLDEVNARLGQMLT